MTFFSEGDVRPPEVIFDMGHTNMIPVESLKLRSFIKDYVLEVDEVTVQIPTSYQMGGEAEFRQELLS